MPLRLGLRKEQYDPLATDDHERDTPVKRLPTRSQNTEGW